MNGTTFCPIIATKKVHKVHIIAYRMKIKVTFQQMMSPFPFKSQISSPVTPREGQILRLERGVRVHLEQLQPLESIL